MYPLQLLDSKFPNLSCVIKDIVSSVACVEKMHRQKMRMRYVDIIQLLITTTTTILSGKVVYVVDSRNQRDRESRVFQQCQLIANKMQNKT